MVSKAAIVFLRVPEKGRVKTRLSKFLSETFVLELYKGFIGDILEALETAGDKVLYSWPPGKEEILQRWLENKYIISVQQGDDLGQRMFNAFVDIFKKGYDQALLIGTDIPELSKEIIALAYKTLETEDVVIGPSGDGGYYLIGFRKPKFSKNIFKGIDWSTKKVLDQTLHAIKKISIQYKLLPELNDIDTKKDFEALVSRVKKGGQIGEKTRKILTAYED